ncbi:hypothetical protein DX135_06105, partial [Listeria monocytogenes]|nr:hypothetical protein [Listeria monocytogenes]
NFTPICGRYSKIIQFVNQTAKSAIKHSFKTIHLSFFINFSSKKKITFEWICIFIQSTWLF